MISIEKSNMHSWAFTVKKLGPKELYDSDYNFIMNVFRRYGEVTDHCFEKDSKGKLHIHGIIQLPKSFLRKRLCISGYHVKLKEIYDYNGWVEYMTKDVTKDRPPVETLKDLFEGDTKIIS